MKKKYMRKLEALFRAMDKEGYGTVSEKKLTALFANPKAGPWRTLQHIETISLSSGC